MEMPIILYSLDIVNGFAMSDEVKLVDDTLLVSFTHRTWYEDFSSPRAVITSSVDRGDENRKVVDVVVSASHDRLS